MTYLPRLESVGSTPGVTDELSAMDGWQVPACSGDSGVGGYKVLEYLTEEWFRCRNGG